MSDKFKRILVIGLGFVMGVGLIIYGATELLNSKRLAARGIPVQAQVVDVQDHISSRLRRHTYYLQVSFTTPEAGPVSKRVKVTHETFVAAQPGGQVKAYYLAENPRICAAGETVDLRYGNLIFGLLVLGGVVFLLVTLNAPSETDKLAEKIEAHLQPMMRERFEYAPARAQDFAHLDLSFYDTARTHLQERGYSFLADEENVSLKMEVCDRTFLRLLLSNDQTTIAFLYQLKVSKPGGKNVRVMDLESWFSNGQFVTTSNAAAAGAFDSPPGIDPLHLPPETTWDAILDAHQKHVQEFLSKNSGSEPVKLEGLEGVRRFQNELQRTKAQFRRRTGVSKTELERLVKGHAGVDVNALYLSLSDRLKQRNVAPA